MQAMRERSVTSTLTSDDTSLREALERLSERVSCSASTAISLPWHSRRV